MKTLLALLLSLVGFNQAFSQDFEWHMYQCWPEHRGYLPISVDSTTLSLRWQTQIGTQILGEAIAAEGKVFVNSREGSEQGIYAFDAVTGSSVWTKDTSFASLTLPVAYYQGILFFQSVDGPFNTWLYMLEARTGDPAGQIPYDTQFQRYLAPTVNGHDVYVPGGYSGGMYSIDSRSRQVKWFQEVSDDDMWTPAMDQNGGAYAYTGGYLTRVDEASGSLDYQVQDPNWIPGPGSIHQAPVIGEQNNILVTNNSRLVSFDKTTGAIQWERTSDFRGQVSLHDGLIYVRNYGEIEARSEQDGSLVWHHQTIGNARGAILLTNQHAFYCTEDDTYALNLATQAIDWSYPANGLLSIGQGNLYIAEDNGVLSAIGYQHQPTVESIIPKTINYYQAEGAKSTISGFGFDEPGTTQVLFDGIAATNVQIIDPFTIECDMPAMESSKADITVIDSNGNGTLFDGITFTPYQELVGSLTPGGVVWIHVTVQPNDDFLLWMDLGDPYAQGQPWPPYIGLRWLEDLRLMISRHAFPHSTFSKYFWVPPNPNLIGQNLGIQTLAGPFVVGGQGAFSNLSLNTFY